MSPDKIKSTNEVTHERIGRAADKAKKGVSDTVRRAQDKIDAAADRTEEGVQNATEAATHGARRAAEKAGVRRDRDADLASDAGDCADQATDRARAFVRNKPIESIVIALAAGWLLGRLLQPRQ